MGLSPGVRRTLIALVVIGLVVAAVVAGAPLVIKKLTLDYLDNAGVTATIGNVDANLFTGQVDYYDAKGQTGHGDGFNIGHLALNLTYLPLFSRQLSLSRMALDESRIDIHRTADNTLRVAGIRVLGGPGDKKQPASSWGFGLKRLRLAALKLVYTQPGGGKRADVKRVLSFNPSSASDVFTWQPDTAVPVDANMAIAGSQITLKGRITPFGAGITANLDLMTKGFSLGLIAPVTQSGTLTRLAGRIDTDSHITASYTQKKGLTLAVKGHSQWHDARMTFGSGLDVRSKAFGWNGDASMALLRPHGQTSHINADGKASLDTLKTIQPGGITVTQANGQWQGTANTRLDRDATQVVTNGNLSAGKLNLDWGNWLTFNAGHYQWQGKAVFIAGDLFAQRLDGKLSTRDARLNMTGQPLAVTADRLDYDGFFRRIPGQANKALTIHMGGSIDTSQIAAQQTALGAPWMAAGKAQVKDFSVDGVNHIRFARLATKQLRLLGDTNSDVSVLAAPDASGTDFAITDRRHYRFGALNIDRPQIYLRRSADGLGVLSKFLGGSQNKKKNTSQQASNPKNATTYAVDQLKLSNGRLSFVDTAVNPRVNIDASNVTLALDTLDTANPERDANYRLSAGLGQYGHIDSQGKIAPLAADGTNMDVSARMRSLAMAPLSGYMNQAVGRGIARGSTDGNLNLKASNGQLDGSLDIALSNFRLANGRSKQTEVALGVSLDTALSLVRNDNDVIDFTTDIEGDFSNPQFSIQSLVRKAIFAGLRAAVTSVYSPLGLLGKAGEAISNIGQALSFHPIAFKPGAHDLSDDARDYLSGIGTALSKRPGVKLTLTGHAAPADAGAMSFFGGAEVTAGNRGKLAKLAKARAASVRDYLAAREIAPKRLRIAQPAVDDNKQAKPQMTFSLGN